MSSSKLCLAALLLLAACGPSGPDRARLAALHMLQHQLPPAAHLQPESLVVYDFSQAQLRHFSSDVPTFHDGHLVTYVAGPNGGAPRKQAVYVADNDSAFFFLPLRNAAEFARRFGVQAPVAVP